MASIVAINVSLEWDLPFYTTSGVTSDLDIYVLNATTGRVVAYSDADNIANQTPNERVFFQNTGSMTQQYEIAINLYAGPISGRIKTVNYGSNQFGNVTFTPATNSSTITPHAGSPNAAAVAVAPARNQKTTEGFSSSGPTTLLFDASGNRLATPLVVSKPDFVAPDGVDTTTAASTYSTRTFNLGQLAATLGLTLTADTQVKFQQDDARSFMAPRGGIAFDNVQVDALSSLTQALVENGAVQRSAVRSISLTFQGHIAGAPAAAFTLTRTEDGQTFPVVPSAPVVSGGSTSLTLTLGGPNLDGTLLPDGRYVLTIDGTQILDDAGHQADAADSGVTGSQGTLSFSRCFGDAQGNGVVDASDHLLFLSAYLRGNATGANSIFDPDGNGTFDVVDLAAFDQLFRIRTLA